jgi:hypothetical protein
MFAGTGLLLLLRSEPLALASVQPEEKGEADDNHADRHGDPDRWRYEVDHRHPDYDGGNYDKSSPRHSVLLDSGSPECCPSCPRGSTHVASLPSPTERIRTPHASGGSPFGLAVFILDSRDRFCRNDLTCTSPLGEPSVTADVWLRIRLLRGRSLSWRGYRLSTADHRPRVGIEVRILSVRPTIGVDQDPVIRFRVLGTRRRVASTWRTGQDRPLGPAHPPNGH